MPRHKIQNPYLDISNRYYDDDEDDDEKEGWEDDVEGESFSGAVVSLSNSQLKRSYVETGGVPFTSVVNMKKRNKLSGDEEDSEGGEDDSEGHLIASRMGVEIGESSFEIGPVIRKGDPQRQDGIPWTKSDKADRDNASRELLWYNEQQERLDLVANDPNFQFVQMVAGLCNYSNPLDLYDESDIAAMQRRESSYARQDALRVQESKTTIRKTMDLEKSLNGAINARKSDIAIQEKEKAELKQLWKDVIGPMDVFVKNMALLKAMEFEVVVWKKYMGQVTFHHMDDVDSMAERHALRWPSTDKDLQQSIDKLRELYGLHQEIRRQIPALFISGNKRRERNRSEIGNELKKEAEAILDYVFSRSRPIAYATYISEPSEAARIDLFNLPMQALFENRADEVIAFHDNMDKREVSLPLLHKFCIMVKASKPPAVVVGAMAPNERRVAPQLFIYNELLTNATDFVNGAQDDNVVDEEMANADYSIETLSNQNGERIVGVLSRICQHLMDSIVQPRVLETRLYSDEMKKMRSSANKRSEMANVTKYDHPYLGAFQATAWFYRNHIASLENEKRMREEQLRIVKEKLQALLKGTVELKDPKAPYHHSNTWLSRPENSGKLRMKSHLVSSIAAAYEDYKRWVLVECKITEQVDVETLQFDRNIREPFARLVKCHMVTAALDNPNQYYQQNARSAQKLERYNVIKDLRGFEYRYPTMDELNKMTIKTKLLAYRRP
jgi:hypothetical protein